MAALEAQYSWLEMLKCLAWRVVEERGEKLLIVHCVISLRREQGR
jgi:hypothetical protein